LTVTYNPRLKNPAALVAQQPDFMLSLLDREWPTVRLVVDAKYRINSSPEYVERYGTPDRQRTPSIRFTAIGMRSSSLNPPPASHRG